MISVDNTYGALLIGIIIAGVLYGFACVQTWYYFAQYPSDPWSLKSLVLVVLFLETGHQVLITHAIYTYVITNFASIEKLGVLEWSVVGEIFFNALVTLLVQLFLTMRIWKLSQRNYYMTGIPTFLIVSAFAITMAFAFQAIHFTTFAQLITLRPLSLTINTLVAAGDAFIAGFLCYLLQISRTGVRSSERLINKLIMYSINTGLLTSFCALATFICYILWTDAIIYGAFYFCTGRLYCNSLLATLNARKTLRAQDNSTELTFCTGQSGSNATNSTKLTSSTRTANTISVKIDTTQELVSDERDYTSINEDKKGLESV